MDQNAATCRWLVLQECYPGQAIFDAIFITEVVQQDAKEQRVAMQRDLERGRFKYAQTEQFQGSPAQWARKEPWRLVVILVDQQTVEGCELFYSHPPMGRRQQKR